MSRSLPCIVDWAECAKADTDQCCPQAWPIPCAPSPGMGVSPRAGDRRQFPLAQCKAKFCSVLCYMRLDGSVTGELQEEAVCLLLRAAWRAPSRDKGKAPAHRYVDEEGDVSFEGFYEEEDELEDEDELLAMRHHAAARLLIGNRRHGPNGYLAGGRMLARPLPPPQPAKGRKGVTPPHAAPSTPVGSGSQPHGGEASGSGSASSSTPSSAPRSASSEARNALRAKREARDAIRAEKEADRRARRFAAR